MNGILSYFQKALKYMFLVAQFIYKIIDVPGIWMKTFDFVQLTLIVKSHGVDVIGSSVADVRCHFGWVGKDYAISIHTQILDLCYLSLGSTVKPCSKGCQHRQHQLIVIALHSWNDY